MVAALAKAIAGDHYLELLDVTVTVYSLKLLRLLLQKCECPVDSGEAFLEAISLKYASSTNRREKLELLSLVLSVKSYCHQKVSHVPYYHLILSLRFALFCRSLSTRLEQQLHTQRDCIRLSSTKEFATTETVSLNLFNSSHGLYH